MLTMKCNAFVRKCHKNWLSRNDSRASLVAQWLRVRLPMQGTRVRALVWEDPTCRGATKPVSHSYWACASGACAPQRERPRQWEARAPRWRMAPARRNWRKPSHRNEDPMQPKINKLINFLKIQHTRYCISSSLTLQNLAGEWPREEIQ